MRMEIAEQPDALRRVVGQRRHLREVAAAIVDAKPNVVRLVGHGTSDNVATYGVYAFGLLAGWTALRDSISLSVYYDAPIDPRGSAVIAISQSGETPDVVEYVRRARKRGALTIGITNHETSALAETAELVVPLGAGEEHAVAATKTYTSSIAAVALLAGGVSGRSALLEDDVLRTADIIEEAIPGLERTISRATSSFAFLGRMFVIGRGLELATAREIALKLQETCRVAADGLTATALAHGPVNAVDPFFPVWAIATIEENLDAVIEAARRARAAGATLIATGAAADRIEAAAYSFVTPPVPNVVLSPLVSVLPGQLFARSLSVAKGYDPDRPVHLSKVTRVP